MLFLLFVQLSLFAQRQYATAELQEIGQLLDEHRLPHIERIEPQTKMVTHLGLPLFVENSEYPYSYIFRFIERFTLYAKLLPPTERRHLLSDNKVQMDLEKVAAVDSATDFSLNSDETTFYAVWPNCKMSFPKDFHLIMGLNKKESDLFFQQRLMDYCNSHEKQTIKRIPIAMPTDSLSFQVEKGEYYIIREMNSNRYFLNIGNGKRLPVFGDKYASESVSNMFQQLVNADFTIHITQNLYNYKRVEYSLPLSTFTNFCASDGCQTYVGIEEEDVDKVKAVVVYHNDFFAYNHLLYIEVERKVLSDQSGEINGTLYSYIPTHNLKNLFRDGQK